MGFLRRLLKHETSGETPGTADVDSADMDADEREHELEMLRGEQERLGELAQRQLRYAKYAWEPPAQGGSRRADDGDAPGR